MIDKAGEKPSQQRGTRSQQVKDAWDEADKRMQEELTDGTDRPGHARNWTKS